MNKQRVHLSQLLLDVFLQDILEIIDHDRLVDAALPPFPHFEVRGVGFFAALLRHRHRAEAELARAVRDIEGAVSAKHANRQILQVVAVEQIGGVHDGSVQPQSRISASLPCSIPCLISRAILRPVDIGTSYLRAV